MLQIYIVFHKFFYSSFYTNINTVNKEKLVLYGVKESHPNDTGIKCIYENNLDLYNPSIQKNRFNEGSCIYHIYTNKLHEKTSYIGMFQYDMKIQDSTITEINNKITSCGEPTIFAGLFAIEESKNRLHGSLQFITTSFSNFGSGLDNYNAFFNKSYTIDDVKKNQFIMCNTYVIPTQMFEKMMTWLILFFHHKVNQREIEKIYFQNPGFEVCGSPEKIINPGHILEALTAMFLSLELSEGVLLYPINIEHDHDYKL